MANTIVKFPDERTEVKDIITAYHEINGTDYIVFKTDKVDNGNEVVGVSYKPVGEDRFQKIVDMEEWKKAKGILVDDIHEKQDNFTYVKVDAETLVTEDYIHDLALRDANKEALANHYEEFLKQQDATNTVQMPNPEVVPNPEVAPVDVAPIQETPVVAEATPVIEEPTVVPFPGLENIAPIEQSPVTPEPIAPQAPVAEVQTQPEIPVAPVVETPIAETPVVETPAPVQPTSESVVTESYVTKARGLIEDFKEIADKFTKNMEELADEMGRQLEEAHHINELSKQTFDNAQQILNSQNNDVLTRDLNKAA